MKKAQLDPNSSNKRGGQRAVVSPVLKAAAVSILTFYPENRVC